MPGPNKKYTCIIVDDMELDRLVLQAHLDSYPFLEVAGSFGKPKEALGFVQNSMQPDIMFLDIDMPEMTGLHLRSHLEKVPACIFITNHPEFGLESFEMAALDYPVNPINEIRFEKTMQRLQEFLELRSMAAAERKILPALHPTAAEYYFKALTIAEAIHNVEQISLVNSNLSSCFFNQKNYEKSIQYAEVMLTNARLAGKSRNVMRALSQLAVSKAMLKDTAAAKVYLDSALSIAERTGNRVEMADELVDRAALESEVRKQIELNLRAERILAEVSANSATVLVNDANLGSEYLLLAKSALPSDKATLLQKSASYLQKGKALAETTNSRARLADILNMLVDLDDRPGGTGEWMATAGERYTILSIADNGPGLSPDQAKALTDDSIADNARDGFGFHLIRDLAKAIRCRLDVKTDPGKGTIFSIIIPSAA